MPVASIKLVSTKAKDIDAISKQIKTIANTLNIKSRGPIPLPVHNIIHTTRKTPCADGSHTFEKWQMRVHKRLLYIESDEQVLRQVMRIQVPDTVQIEISLSN
ncbi:MAG: 30S ribosomal protein S10 [Candidatus Micrarchaeaceae archaeon]